MELQLQNAQLKDAIQRQRRFTDELAEQLQKSELQLEQVLGTLERQVRDEQDVQRQTSALKLSTQLSRIELALRLVDAWRENRGLKAEVESAMEIHRRRLEEKAMAERITPVVPGEMRIGQRIFLPMEVLFIYNDGRQNPYGMKLDSGFVVNLEAKEFEGAFIPEVQP